MANSNTPGNNKVYIDCTVTFNTGLNTGIQRVVRNLVSRAETGGKILNTDCIPVVSAFGRFWSMNDLESLFNSKGIKKIIIDAGKKIIKSAEKTIIVFLSVIFVLALKTKLADTVAKWYKKFRLVIFSILRTIAEYMLMITLFFYLITGKVARVTPKDGDLILLVDAFWAYNSLSIARKIKNKLNNLCIISVLYDLVPIYNPETCNESVVTSFKNVLPEFLSCSDGIMCISKTVELQLKGYLDEFFAHEKDRLYTDYFYLGSDIISSDSTIANIDSLKRKWPTPFFKQKQRFLMVGTIEPRKNYSFVLDAFEKLWQKNTDISLCIVGRVGWNVEDLLYRIKNHPQLNINLFWLFDVNDEELEWLYSNSESLIFASYSEGFGLPLVESMQKGLSVISSDIPIFREIGKDYPIYFSLTSPDNLVESINLMLANQNNPNIVRHEKQEWISWDSAAEIFYKKSGEIWNKHKQLFS